MMFFVILGAQFIRSRGTNHSGLIINNHRVFCRRNVFRALNRRNEQFEWNLFEKQINISIFFFQFFNTFRSFFKYITLTKHNSLKFFLSCRTIPLTHSSSQFLVDLPDSIDPPIAFRIPFVTWPSQHNLQCWIATIIIPGLNLLYFIISISQNSCFHYFWILLFPKKFFCDG